MIKLKDFLRLYASNSAWVVVHMGGSRFQFPSRESALAGLPVIWLGKIVIYFDLDEGVLTVYVEE